MKKNGFTLVELLAVIIIMSLIALVTITIVTPIINDSENEISSIQKKKIEEAAKAYYIEKGIDENDTCPSIVTLINLGYIDASVFKLVETGELYPYGYVKIETKSNGSAIYTYQINSCE